MRSIWAVAKNTIKQAVRVKIAVVFIVLLLVILPVMGSVMTGDGTLKGRLQTFISYGFSLMSLLLCLFTIVISVYTVSSDLKDRQAFTVLTKPIRRYQYLLGKLMGVAVLDVALLVFFASAIYGIARVMPAFVDADERQQQAAQNEFYTARVGLTPGMPDVSDEVMQTFEELKKNGEVPQEVFQSQRNTEEYLQALEQQKRMERRAAGPGDRLVWQFENVWPADPGSSIFVRYKYDVSYNPADLQIIGNWFVGDSRAYPYRGYGLERKDLIRTFHELEVPAEAVADDGFLSVGFLNMPVNGPVVIFPFEDGLEVLYKKTSWEDNFVRAALLILWRLLFLICMGILAATFLSFPVALLLCLLVFFAGTVNEFIVESIDILSETVGMIYAFTVEPLLKLLPQFDKYNGGDYLVTGRFIGWSAVAQAGGLMVAVKGGLLFALSVLIFSFKEIDKIVV